MDKRFLQANKEALLSLLLTIAYLIGWTLSAYCLGNEPGVTGFPQWFEVSCLFTPIGFILICCTVVKFQFKDIPLESDIH